MSVPKDFTGVRFGDLTATRFSHVQGNSRCWEFLCACGSTVTAYPSNVARAKQQCCPACRKASRGSRHPSWQGVGDLSQTKWSRIENSARTRGMQLELTIQQAWDLFRQQHGRCALTGWEIEIRYYRTTKHTASLDRVDSSLGYFPDNVQWVHKDVNLLKRNFTEPRLIEMCRAIADHACISPQGVVY